MDLKERFEPMEATGKVVYESGETNVEESAEQLRGPNFTGTPDDAERQPVPDESMCPYCGGEPTDESARDHQLSAIGYMHDDIRMECADCDTQWTCGVPIGEVDDGRAEDLFCDSCTQRYMRIHRVAPDWNARENRKRVLLHLKCPNCFYFDKAVRDCGPKGISLVGYPDITGSTEDADAYGWPEDE